MFEYYLLYLFETDVTMKDKILELKKQGLTSSEIVRVLGCAKSTVSYHLNRNGLGKEVRLNNEVIKQVKEYYLTHSLIETSTRFGISTSSVSKYADIKRSASSYETRKKNKIEAVQRRRTKIKQLAVDYCGGKCIKCGYDKYIGALEFHHVDPTKKDFSIGGGGHTRKWEITKKELDKCLLLCSNCHKEEHERIRNETNKILSSSVG